MLDAHGVECEATWSDVPSVLTDGVTGTLVVSSGPYAGSEVTVHIDTAVDGEVSDTFSRTVHSDEYETMLCSAVSEGLGSMAGDSYAMRAWIDDVPYSDVSFSDFLEQADGAVRVFFSPDAVASQDELDDLMRSVSESVYDQGFNASIYFVVVALAPDDGVMTEEFGQALASDGGSSVVFRATGYVTQSI